ncbi:hypothetical protein SDC9_71390 [bioreactor metagenome]|uniref:Uncharacterized protein n=1 Tax=bioreactor metagenome TaxID=1076179 RepID=A0A644Y8G0_9ZZZZ
MGNAQTQWYTCIFADFSRYLFGKGRKFVGSYAFQVKKCLVNGVDFGRRHQSRNRIHNPGGHVGIQCKIGRKNTYVFPPDKLFNLE